MQEVSSILELFQRYFQLDIVVTILIVLAPWIIEKLSKKQKIFLSCMLAVCVLVFNGVVFWLMERLGEEETYYRLLWVLPVTCVFAGLLIKAWEMLKNRGQKLAFAVMLFVAFFVYSNGFVDNWKPTNLYYLSEETMQLADIIQEDSHDRAVNLYSYSDATYGIRQYNAKIALVGEELGDSLCYMLAYDLRDVSGMIVNAVVINREVEYAYVEKEKKNAQLALEGGGAVCIGETQKLKVYRFDLEEAKRLHGIRDNVGMTTGIEIWGKEFAFVKGIEEKLDFVLYDDGHIAVPDSTGETVSYYLNEDSEFQTAQFGELVVCLIDNMMGTVTEETINAFAELMKQGKPVILLLREPLVTEATDEEETVDAQMLHLQELITGEGSLVEQIYSIGNSEAYRTVVGDEIIQCVCMPNESGYGVLISVRGEE